MLWRCGAAFREFRVGLNGRYLKRRTFELHGRREFLYQLKSLELFKRDLAL
jgi:hypothetical protein